jgi:aconitate hydratase
MFAKDYADVFEGDERWQRCRPRPATPSSGTKSTYVRKPPYFDGMTAQPEPGHDISGARVLLKLGDSVTTDHISPAGNIKGHPGRQVPHRATAWSAADFNSYGSRRGNHEVMIRGTFANIRLKNQIAPGVEGGFTRDFTRRRPAGPSSTTPRRTTRPPASRWSSWPARSTAPARRATGPPRAPRCWASRPSSPSRYERIHRSNLIGMGVLPLQFPAGENAESLGLTGEETFSVTASPP